MIFSENLIKLAVALSHARVGLKISAKLSLSARIRKITFSTTWTRPTPKLLTIKLSAQLSTVTTKASNHKNSTGLKPQSKK